MKEILLPIFLGLLFGKMIGYHENHNTVSEQAQLHAAYVQTYYIQSFYASLINFAVIHTQILSSACGKAKLAIELLSSSLCMLQHRLYIQAGKSSCNVMDKTIKTKLCCSGFHVQLKIFE